MKQIKKIERAADRYKTKKKFKNMLLKYTIFAPFYVYYKLDDKYRNRINIKYYENIMKNKEKFKNKVLKEIIDYIIKKDMPREIARNKHNNFVYTIFLEKHYDISANLHLKDFISYRNYVGRKTYNKQAKKYYNACDAMKQDVEYDWFMAELENYFAQSGFKVKRDIYKSWYEESEYIDLSLK